MLTHADSSGSSGNPSSSAKKPLPKKSQVDLQKLAERLLKLMKEQARLEAEREGRLRP